MRKVNIFIAHTPFQNYVANHMVSNMDEFNNMDNILILDSNHDNLVIQKKSWKEIIVKNPAIGLKFYENIEQRETLLKYILDKVESQYDVMNIFVANISYTLNNLFYGIYMNKCKYKVDITLNNYPEGIANLLLENIGSKQYIKDIIRNVYGIVKGTRYYTYTGDITGIKYSDKVYSLSPEFIDSIDKEIITIPKLNNKKNANNRNQICIILGQPYYSTENEKEFIKIMKEIVEYMNKLGYNNIFYKPHHYEDRNLVNKVSNYVDEVVYDHNPIEQYAIDNNIKAVIGFTSSALINLKSMYGNNIECISYKGLKFIKDVNSKQKLESIYNRIGIRIIK